MAFTQTRFGRFLKTAQDADTAFSKNTAEIMSGIYYLQTARNTFVKQLGVFSR